MDCLHIELKLPLLTVVMVITKLLFSKAMVRAKVRVNGELYLVV